MVTIVRGSKPVKMIKQLVRLGFQITKIFDGVYYVIGALFDTQIIVSSELDDNENKWIKALRRDISKTLYMSVYEDIDKNLNEVQRKMADNVLHTITDANEQLINIWKDEDATMGGALRRIMQPEMEEATRKGERKGINLTIKYSIIDGIPSETIVSRLVEGFGLNEKDAVKYIEEYKERYDG